MESNPYAPPKADVFDVDRDRHALKFRSVWLVIVFLVISFGLYYLIWFFRRRQGLNRLNSSRKLQAWPLWLFAAFLGSQFVVGLFSGSQPVADVIGPAGAGAMTLAQLALGILMIMQCFHVRDIIQDHATPEPDPDQRFVDRVQLSGLMTFFFSILYLQWAINKYVVRARPVLAV